MNSTEMLPRALLPECSGGEAPCPYHEEVLRLRESVRIDPLTQLYNTGHFREALAQEMERTERTLLPTALIMLDLDFFKKVNDQYGHEAGNAVLIQSAKVVRDTTRKLDIQCRYGGEEFAIILPSTERFLAIQVAQRLCTNIAAAPVVFQDNSIAVTASLGVAFYEVGSQLDVSGFIAQADKCLYEAKNNGRNQVRFVPAPKVEATVSSEEKAALKGLFDS